MHMNILTHTLSLTKIITIELESNAFSEVLEHKNVGLTTFIQLIYIIRLKQGFFFKNVA